MDHKSIGEKLQLFSFHENLGSGLVLWMPKGEYIRNLIQNKIRERIIYRKYDFVSSPHIGKLALYEQSGHYPFYADHQFPIMKLDDINSYVLKPMNCPHHILMYKSYPKSYKDMPVRYAEFGQVYRKEDSGSLDGLFRLRGFMQDDGHIFAKQDQVKDEIKKCIEDLLYICYECELYEIKVKLGFRNDSEKYIGDTKVWDMAENEIEEIAKELDLSFVIEKGSAAFYGPKIDFVVKDKLNREWQLGTVQLDYNLPERFDLFFINNENQKERCVMIHRTLLGSIERFIGILLESFLGELPLWLCEEQIRIIPVSDKYKSDCDILCKHLCQDGKWKCKVDNQNGTVGSRKAIAIEEKIPYIIIYGEKEIASSSYVIESLRKNFDNIKQKDH